MKSVPLAEEMRPTSFDEYYGQEFLVGEGAILRKSLDMGKIPSMILWGPPGVGKTTLAYLIAEHLKFNFYKLSAINSVFEVHEVIDNAKKRIPSILFIDEIHRFSKSQQDSLLGAVEQGIVTLVGLPPKSVFDHFSLLSRCQIYIEAFGRKSSQENFRTSKGIIAKKIIEDNSYSLYRCLDVYFGG